VERGIIYDEREKTLYVSAAPYLPIPYVRALMMSGAREDSYIGNRVRAFHNVEPALRDWFDSIIGIKSI
jgi:hypothetical protein